MIEFEISDRAVKATYGAPFTDGVTNKTIRSLLTSAAPVIMAAGLRRAAARLENAIVTGPIDRESSAYRLRVWADEMDSQGGPPVSVARSVSAEAGAALRSLAAEYWRRSDNVPLGRGGSGLNRCAELREVAASIDALADKLDPSGGGS